MTKYQVQSKFRDGKWLDDNLPFDTYTEANFYISKQPKRNYQYRIIAEDYNEEELKEYFDIYSCWDRTDEIY